MPQNFIQMSQRHGGVEIIIHRLSAEGPSKEVIAPLWSLDKRGIVGEIEKGLRLRAEEDPNHAFHPNELTQESVA